MQLSRSWGAKMRLSIPSSLTWYGAYCPVGQEAARYQCEMMTPGFHPSGPREMQHSTRSPTAKRSWTSGMGPGSGFSGGGATGLFRGNSNARNTRRGHRLLDVVELHLVGLAGNGEKGATAVLVDDSDDGVDGGAIGIAALHLGDGKGERGSEAGRATSGDEMRLAVPDSVVGRIQGGRTSDTSTMHEYDLR